MYKYFLERLNKSKKIGNFFRQQSRRLKSNEKESFALIWDEKEALAEGLYNAFEIFLESFLKKEESMFFNILSEANKIDHDFPFEEYFFSNEDYLIDIFDEMLSPNYRPANLACFEIRLHLNALRFFYKMMNIVILDNFPINILLKLDNTLSIMACHISSLIIIFLVAGRKFDFHKNRTQKSTKEKNNKDFRKRRDAIILESHGEAEIQGKPKYKILEEIYNIYNMKTTDGISIYTIERRLKKMKLFPFG
jgi:hypothetical protein